MNGSAHVWSQSDLVVKCSYVYSLFSFQVTYPSSTSERSLLRLRGYVKRFWLTIHDVYFRSSSDSYRMRLRTVNLRRSLQSGFNFTDSEIDHARRLPSKSIRVKYEGNTCWTCISTRFASFCQCMKDVEGAVLSIWLVVDTSAPCHHQNDRIWIQYSRSMLGIDLSSYYLDITHPSAIYSLYLLTIIHPSISSTWKPRRYFTTSECNMTAFHSIKDSVSSDKGQRLTAFHSIKDSVSFDASGFLNTSLNATYQNGFTLSLHRSIQEVHRY